MSSLSPSCSTAVGMRKQVRCTGLPRRQGGRRTTRSASPSPGSANGGGALTTSMASCEPSPLRYACMTLLHRSGAMCTLPGEQYVLVLRIVQSAAHASQVHDLYLWVVITVINLFCCTAAWAATGRLRTRWYSGGRSTSGRWMCAPPCAATRYLLVHSQPRQPFLVRPDCLVCSLMSLEWQEFAEPEHIKQGTLPFCWGRIV